MLCTFSPRVRLILQCDLFSFFLFFIILFFWATVAYTPVRRYSLSTSGKFTLGVNIKQSFIVQYCVAVHIVQANITIFHVCHDSVAKVLRGISGNSSVFCFLFVCSKGSTVFLSWQSEIGKLWLIKVKLFPQTFIKAFPSKQKWCYMLAPFDMNTDVSQWDLIMRERKGERAHEPFNWNLKADIICIICTIQTDWPETNFWKSFGLIHSKRESISKHVAARNTLRKMYVYST